MKPLHYTNRLFIGLALLLSLVALPSVSNTSNSEAIKTTLIVNNQQPTTRFSIHFLKVDKSLVVSFFNFFNHSFRTSKLSFDITSSATFNTRQSKSFIIKTKRFYTEHVAYLNTKILYDHTIV